MFFESIKIMLLGMGTVFLFLIIMVYLTKIMSKIIQRYFPDAPKVPEPIRSVSSVKSNDDKAKVAALVATMYHSQLMNAGNRND